jgi:hypothetical protein
MRLSAPIAVCLSVVLSVSSAHASPINKWRAYWKLVGTDDKNCGAQFSIKETLEFVEGPMLVMRIIPATTGVRRDLRLIDALNADGSGKVRALTDRNRVATLEFAAGNGPRVIRYTAPYSICSYTWTPIREDE